MRTLSPATLFLAALLTSVGSAAHAANMNWDAIEQGAFEVAFTACTADSHPALVRLQMTTYSPMDMVPEGYTQATKEEVTAAANKVFAELYSPYVAQASDSVASGDTYLSDVGTEPVKVVDENGKEMKASLILVSMHNVKAELMKSLKYSGMGVGYELSHVFVNSSAKCTSAQ